MAITLSSSGNAIVTTLNTVLYSNYNFSNWTIINIPSNNQGIKSIYSVKLGSNGTGLVSGNQYIAITKNNGATWSSLGGSSSGTLISVLGSNVSDNGTYLSVASGASPTLNYSINSGNSFNNSGVPCDYGNSVVGNNGVVLFYYSNILLSI
jgi:hypothetical protein